MLIEFRVRNHRSIREEQCLTMEAMPKLDVDDPRLRRVEGHKTPLLCAAGIYGANASGKSNVLDALGWMKRAVRDSHRLWEPDRGVPREPFAWDGGAEEDSLFEITFLDQGIKYQYGFSVDSQKITEEWLYSWPKGRKTVWFEREGDSFHFSKHILGPQQTLQSLTKNNSLFLSVSHQNNQNQIKFIFNKINSIFYFNTDENSFHKNTHLLDFEKPKLDESHIHKLIQNKNKQLFDLVKNSDLGIQDIRSEIEFSYHFGQKNLLSQTKIKFNHISKHQEPSSWLTLENESLGTQHLIKIIPSLLQSFQQGSIYMIDELESSLHPLLASKIIQLFQDPATNPHGAQLIFTTHDATLLGHHPAMEPLRRDQVWFTEKDLYGATKLYPLTRYKITKQEQKKLDYEYLEGRYGGVPGLPWKIMEVGDGQK